MSTHYQGTPTPARAFADAYEASLRDAIRALTEAARLRSPRVDSTLDGAYVEDLSAPTDQMDWAEFVTLALAGGAANLGGVEVILAGRCGSWEVEGVRRLLESTVGDDQSQLWSHRTEPLDIMLYVDELLVDRTDAWGPYLDAQRELDRTHDAAEAELEIDYGRYVWEYDRTAAGGWVAREPAAPPWSVEAWSAAIPGESPAEWGLTRQSDSDGSPDEWLRPATVHLPKSPESARELERLKALRDARLDAHVDREEQLEAQRSGEWAAYGQALKARVQTLAARIPGLGVAITVHVDVESFRPEGSRGHEYWDSLESRLIDQAVASTPTPDDLADTPLHRLMRLDDERE